MFRSIISENVSSFAAGPLRMVSLAVAAGAAPNSSTGSAPSFAASDCRAEARRPRKTSVPTAGQSKRRAHRQTGSQLGGSSAGGQPNGEQSTYSRVFIPSWKEKRTQLVSSAIRTKRSGRLQLRFLRAAQWPQRVNGRKRAASSFPLGASGLTCSVLVRPTLAHRSRKVEASPETQLISVADRPIPQR